MAILHAYDELKLGVTAGTLMLTDAFTPTYTKLHLGLYVLYGYVVPSGCSRGVDTFAQVVTKACSSYNYSSQGIWSKWDPAAGNPDDIVWTGMTNGQTYRTIGMSLAGCQSPVYDSDSLAYYCSATPTCTWGFTMSTGAANSWAFFMVDGSMGASGETLSCAYGMTQVFNIWDGTMHRILGCYKITSDNPVTVGCTSWGYGRGYCSTGLVLSPVSGGVNQAIFIGLFANKWVDYLLKLLRRIPEGWRYEGGILYPDAPLGALEPINLSADPNDKINNWQQHRAIALDRTFIRKGGLMRPVLHSCPCS